MTPEMFWPGVLGGVAVGFLIATLLFILVDGRRGKRTVSK